GEPDATGYVLVGVPRTAQGDAALGFAFEAASLRGAPLLALHAWTGPASSGPGDMLPLVYEPGEVAADESRLLARALAPWPALHPVPHPAGRSRARRCPVRRPGRDRTRPAPDRIHHRRDHRRGAPQDRRRAHRPGGARPAHRRTQAGAAARHRRAPALVRVP